MQRCSRALAIAATLLFLGAGAAQAEEAGPPIPVLVKVTMLSDREGAIEDAKLHERLRHQLRYSSLRVIQKKRLNLHLDEVGSVTLPDGRRVQMRPLQKGPQGVLFAVDVERGTRTDARVKNHHVLVIDAGEFEDGKLAVSIEPQYDEGDASD